MFTLNFIERYIHVYVYIYIFLFADLILINILTCHIVVQSIQDPDPVITCDLMDGRDTFLSLARENNYEFSSLRRVKYSTMTMLYEIHSQGQEKFIYTCNRCNSQVETRYHCTICDDFDLCMKCYQKENHMHKMDKLGTDLEEVSSPNEHKQMSHAESRTAMIERCVQSLCHACQCRNANCHLPACRRMQQVLVHKKMCQKPQNGCSICKQLIALCFHHAKRCQQWNCPVIYCTIMRKQIQEKQLRMRLQQQQLMRRRMAAMTSNTSTLVSEEHSSNNLQAELSSDGSSGNSSEKQDSNIPLENRNMGIVEKQKPDMTPEMQAAYQNMCRNVKENQHTQLIQQAQNVIRLYQSDVPVSGQEENMLHLQGTYLYLLP